MKLSDKDIKKTMSKLNKNPEDTEDDLKKLDKMPRTKYLMTKLIKPEIIMKNHKKIKLLVSDFIKENSKKLSTLGPTYNILFSKEENKKLFKLFDIDKNDIIDIIEECPMINTKWKFLSDPMNIYLSTVTSWLTANRKLCNTSYIDSVRYTVLRDYSMVQKYFFKYEANPEIMDYTIENSLSNRFKLKKFNTILEFLINVADTKVADDSIFYNRIITCEDRYVIYFIQNLHSSLSSMILNIANRYYKNYDDNKRYKEDNAFKNNMEGDMYIEDPNSLSKDIKLLTRRLLKIFFSESHVDKSILKMACTAVVAYKDKNGKKRIDRKMLENMIKRIGIVIETIKEEDHTFVNDIIVSIIAYYLSIKGNSVRDIKSGKFYKEMHKTYSVSNTRNQYVTKIKSLLDNMMMKYSKEFQKTEHKSTTIKMRSCVYFYFVIFIMKNVE